MPARSALAVAAAALLLSATACSPAPPVDDYEARIAAERTRKDESFRQMSGEPILPQDRDRFLPLSYFAIDQDYAVPAQLEPAPQRMRLTMPTSTGKLRDMERVGTLSFALKGQPLKLSAFMEAGAPQVTRLFVPFSDLTSGTETYQAGRYMDLDPTATGIYVVDFNVAYHPYCYYNETYDCPFPPAENRLAVPVRAGERLRPAETTVSR